MLALLLPFGLAFGGLAAIGAIAGVVAAVLWRQASPRRAKAAKESGAGLPPAIEGRSIAFRYEIEASTRGRLGLRERAAETPIGFDVVTR